MPDVEPINDAIRVIYLEARAKRLPRAYNYADYLLPYNDKFVEIGWVDNKKKPIDGVTVLKWLDASVPKPELKPSDNFAPHSVEEWHQCWASLRETATKFVDDSGKGVDMATITLAGEQYICTSRFWVRHKSAVEPPTYEKLAEALEPLDPKSVAEAARLLILRGECTLATESKIKVCELVLAIAGAEYARNRRSFAMAMMMLDLVQSDYRYGVDQAKTYTWEKILTCTNLSDTKARKLEADETVRKALAARHAASASQSRRPFNKAIFALWGGKLPMCHAGSEAEGAMLIDGTNTVLTIKEIQLFAHWARAMLVLTRYKSIEVANTTASLLELTSFAVWFGDIRDIVGANGAERG